MKRTFKTSVLLLALMLVLCACLPSCAPATEKFSAYSLEFFDTATTITGYETSKERFDQISGEVLALLEEYHRLFTIYNRYEGMENLCTVNELKNGVHRVVKVDRKIIDLLLYAKEMYTLTGGKVNIAMGSVLSIWHDYRTAGLDDPFNAELPPKELLDEAAKHTDINNLIIDEKNSTVFISDPKMTLDVGAVAKGYAVEMAAQYLKEKGYLTYIVNVGGNVRAVENKPKGESWTAGIENPGIESDQTYLRYLQISDLSVVTSGSYQRYYTVNGIDYHHIIDPVTLYPAQGYLSVSVVCRHSGMGDALSTALFCMTYEDGLALVESLEDVDALWVFPNGEQKTSSKFGKYEK
ncbi:MAG: FAD:protein FMN transferase [Clostridia bacterium]|nr:FAD:protein FMN transferase [Clostridia bacterium]